MTASEIPALELLGARVTPMTAATLHATIAEAIRTRRRCVIGHHNLHAIYLFHRDAKMRRFYAHADYVFIDGMPLVWLGRARGMPVHRGHRITSLDWLPPLLARAAAQGWRVMLLGGRPGTAARAAERLRGEHPGLEIAAEHGYFDPAPASAEGRAVLGRIADYAPQLLCVGMGMPRQEHWIHDHAEQLGPMVVVALGAFADYLAGEVPLPPRWLGPLGLEGLYRLVSTPRRVWRRYLLEPWALLPIVTRELREGRTAPADPV